MSRLSPHASAGRAHHSSGRATVAYRRMGLLPNSSTGPQRVAAAAATLPEGNFAAAPSHVTSAA
eukprot:1046330-Heterocapsa_arctica.AAC.1